MTRLRTLLAGVKASAHGAWSALLRLTAVVKASTPAPAAAAVAQLAVDPAGSRAGWLRVLEADQLLQSVQADKALREVWRQSRLSSEAWQRDCLPALLRYAEFVQLAPASEAHHHAHAGGLLSHTIEMLLAAMTWRNGHLLPAGAPIEIIDAERDEWTYVVFFGALLHDIAKVMTDLRIQWRVRDMAEPLRWMPLTGSLPQITRGRAGPEYLVEFTPKSARDYTAHSRLAMMLLPSIAPTTALSFLARQPRTFEALNQYLTGQDKDSLLAQIIRRADRASTERSLLSGSKARFGTATALPLIDLLMQAIGSMLRAGTVLPLNRSGAAGWVHDGSLWFVAKRLADSVRAWIKTHAPDESVPGDAKNDRLFDTWQEYGCILVNPASGQAIWYVTVHGSGGEAEGEQEGEEKTDAGQRSSLKQVNYQHSLTMLRFPLAKLYADPAQYPTDMRGRIEVQAKRMRNDDAASIDQDDEAATAVATLTGSTPAVPPEKPDLHGAAAQTQAGKPLADRPKPEKAIKEPGFNKPKPKPGSSGVSKHEPATVQPIEPAPAEAATTASRPDNQNGWPTTIILSARRQLS